MALNKCYECGRMVSSRAKACPACGAPAKPPPSAAGCLFVLLLLVAAAAAVSILNNGGDDPPQPARQPPRSSTIAGQNSVAVASGPIRCDQFAISAAFEGADSQQVRRIRVSIETDLPDTTDVMFGIDRSFVNAADRDEYAVGYVSEKAKVGEWRSGRIMELDQTKWEAKLEQECTIFHQSGEKLSVSHLDSDVTIAFVVPVAQSDKRFGLRNENLVGSRVQVSNGLRIVRVETKLHWPVRTPPLDQTAERAREAERKFVRQKLAELDSFRKKPTFRQFGFGRGGPHYRWLEEVKARWDQPRPSVVVGDLLNLGMDYVSTQGQDTEDTRIVREEIAKFTRE